MIDATVHFRNRRDEQRTFSTLPRAGDLLDVDGKLWQVQSVVFGEGATVDIYAIQWSDTLTADTRREWEAWADIAVPAGPAMQEQGELFA
jgi:hypothetical protein